MIKIESRRKWILPTIVFVVLLIVASLSISAYLFPQGNNISSNKLFQKGIENFAQTIAVADGKFLTLDLFGYLTCFDTQNGNKLWKAEVGSWHSGGLIVFNGKIYVGIPGGVVQTIDESNGRSMMNYSGLVSSNWGAKGPPVAFYVVDGRVFIEHNGCNAYNEATGEMLWKSYPPWLLNPPGMPYSDNIWPFEENLVLCQGMYPNDDNYIDGIYRIDPDKGTALWGVEGTIDQKPLIYENNVILPDYSQDGNAHYVLAVTNSSGAKIWRFDVGAAIFKPLISDDKLLFAAEDGNFYALNLSNGTLAWKTPLEINSDVDLSSAALSPIAIDDQKGTIFWAYGVTKANESNEYANYDCTLYRLDLATGQNLAKTRFEGNATGPFQTQNNPVLGLALLKNTAYLTTQTDLWIFNKTSLTVLGTEHFDHSLVPPIAANEYVYVSADLYAIAYKDIG